MRRKGRKRRKTVRRRRNFHALTRAYERYGIVFSERDLNAIVAQIQQHECTFVRRCSNTKTVLKLRYQGTDFIVVYSSIAKQVLTFLSYQEYENPMLASNAM